MSRVVNSFVILQHVGSIVSTQRLVSTDPIQFQNPDEADDFHPHPDGVVRLEDDFVGGLTDNDVRLNGNDNLHKLTIHFAPVILALYVTGRYLSMHQLPSTELVDVGGDSIEVGPLLVGGILLLATGIWMLNWSSDIASNSMTKLKQALAIQMLKEEERKKYS